MLKLRLMKSLRYKQSTAIYDRKPISARASTMNNYAQNTFADLTAVTGAYLADDVSFTVSVCINLTVGRR